MLRTVTKVSGPRYGLADAELVSPGVCLHFKECGHLERRPWVSGRLWTKVHCRMCTFLYAKREAKRQKRALRQAKKEVRKLKMQKRVEEQMAKKMASAKVTKKKDLKKKSGDKKKSARKTGRKWYLCSSPRPEKKSIVAKVL